MKRSFSNDIFLTAMIIALAALPAFGNHLLAGETADAQKLRKELARKDLQIKQLKLLLDNAILKGKLAEREAKASQLKAEVERQNAELARKKAELALQRGGAGQRKVTDNLKAKLVELQNTNKQLQDRLKALLERNKLLTRRIAQLEAKLPRPPGKGRLRPGVKPNPPQFAIKGIVNRVDKTNKDLVEISLGKDHGIKIGHTLEVFRMKPRPEYIGMLQIQATSPKSAVGRMVRMGMFGSKKTPRVGDSVASKILPR